MMSGETDILKLLAGLDPKVDSQTYVFASLEKAETFIGLSPIMMFNEEEGVTGIIPLEKAEAAGIEFAFPCKKITLQIHSSLEAVGLIATISEALEEEDVPANVVSAFYHDHIFVPVDKVDDAMKAIGVLMGEKENPDT